MMAPSQVPLAILDSGDEVIPVVSYWGHLWKRPLVVPYLRWH